MRRPPQKHEKIIRQALIEKMERAEETVREAQSALADIRAALDDLDRGAYESSGEEAHFDRRALNGAEGDAHVKPPAVDQLFGDSPNPGNGPTLNTPDRKKLILDLIRRMGGKSQISPIAAAVRREGYTGTTKRQVRYALSQLSEEGSVVFEEQPDSNDNYYRLPNVSV